MSSSILWPVLNVEFTSDEFNAEMSIYCNWSDSLYFFIFSSEKRAKKAAAEGNYNYWPNILDIY